MTTLPTTLAARPEAAAPVVVAEGFDPRPVGLAGTLEAIHELSKPRITRLVTITSAVGFTLAAIGRAWEVGDLLLAAVGCLVGTALSSAGANALNQWWERGRDARMPRTVLRPLPQRRISAQTAFVAGLAFSAAGVLSLLVAAGPAPALVALVTILIYVLVYTPLKPVTPLNTLVGAVPGALPPLIGWSAAADLSAFPADFGFSTLLEAGGWALFLLMFVWQVPHSLALAWMYRDDYAKGGYRMLPVVDPTGATTSGMILLWAAALLPVTVAPAVLMSDRLSPVFGVVAGASGSAFLWACVRLFRSRGRTDAKKVFLASIMHLPLLLIVMVGDALVGAIV